MNFNTIEDAIKEIGVGIVSYARIQHVEDKLLSEGVKFPIGYYKRKREIIRENSRKRWGRD